MVGGSEEATTVLRHKVGSARKAGARYIRKAIITARANLY